MNSDQIRAIEHRRSERVKKLEALGRGPSKKMVLTLWDAFWCAAEQGTVTVDDISWMFKLSKSSAGKIFQRIQDYLVFLRVPFERKEIEFFKGPSRYVKSALKVDMQVLQTAVDARLGL